MSSPYYTYIIPYKKICVKPLLNYLFIKFMNLEISNCRCGNRTHPRLLMRQSSSQNSNQQFGHPHRGSNPGFPPWKGDELTSYSDGARKGRQLSTCPGAVYCALQQMAALHPLREVLYCSKIRFDHAAFCSTTLARFLETWPRDVPR